jgi:hypothetical protein
MYPKRQLLVELSYHISKRTIDTYSSDNKSKSKSHYAWWSVSSPWRRVRYAAQGHVSNMVSDCLLAWGY